MDLLSSISNRILITKAVNSADFEDNMILRIMLERSGLHPAFDTYFVLLYVYNSRYADIFQYI